MPGRGKPFKAGYDERRHYLTKSDRAKGYAAAPSRIKARIRGLYRKHGKKWPATPPNFETFPVDDNAA